MADRTVTEYRLLGIDFEDGDEVVETLLNPTTDRVRFEANCPSYEVVNDPPYDGYRREQRTVTYGEWEDMDDGQE